MNIKYFILVACLTSSYIVAMDLQQLTADLQAKKEQAAKLSKKIYVGSLENKSYSDVIVSFDTPEGKKSFPLAATVDKQVVYLHELIKLTQLKGKPDYMGSILVEKQSSNSDDPYKQMTIFLALNFSNSCSFGATTFPPIQGHRSTSNINLDEIKKSQEIVVDAVIEGIRFKDSTVSCRLK